MEWYSIIRHSVDCKIMVRFPKQVLLVKAQMLYQEYCARCLRNSLQPEFLDVTPKWLNELLDEYRIAQRLPNRKFKVPRHILAERLEIFWLSVAKLRKLVQLHFGYDPDCRNVDQSPFHGNEAGSAACNTLALKGAPTVPLIENHHATRERWSLNSITDSSAERVLRRLPGFELMFKADGHHVEAELQEYVFAKGKSFRVTVVTGPSGSYREEHICNCLEKHLEKWGPGRRWEFMFLDAYAPGLTDNIQRLCWTRGYILVTHGGGASMVCQTNDTDLHKWIRKRFIELQTALMINKARETGGGMVDLTRKENIDIMIEVMSDVNLHLQACKGYKYTGTTVSFDGTEDSLICREAAQFWREREMRKKINSAVAEIEERFNAGFLPWNYATVQSLIGAYPHKGHLDVLKIGQEDEATPDPDGVPWEADEEPVAQPAGADGAGGGGSDACEDGESDHERECFVFDPADWHAPPEEPEQGEFSNHGDGGESSHHGGGDESSRHGDGGVISSVVPRGESLSAEQATSLLEHSGRLQSLQQAKDILKNLGGALGDSLTNTVDRVIHGETKKYRQRIRGDALVDKEMRASLEAEEKRYRHQRAEFQEHMQQKKEKKRVEKELQDVKARLKRARKENREAEAVVTAREAVKSYTVEMLGNGKKKGGTAQHHKARLEVLQRVRLIADLSLDQANDWDYFKVTWDKEMAEAKGEEWGALFAEIVQHVLDELSTGNRNALSDFMHQETHRVLGAIPALRVPGVS